MPFSPTANNTEAHLWRSFITEEKVIWSCGINVQNSSNPAQLASCVKKDFSSQLTSSCECFLCCFCLVSLLLALCWLWSYVLVALTCFSFPFHVWGKSFRSSIHCLGQVHGSSKFTWPHAFGSRFVFTVKKSLVRMLILNASNASGVIKSKLCEIKIMVGHFGIIARCLFICCIYSFVVRS